MYNNNEWGTVCDDSWEANDAKVLCRQLGFPVEGARAYGNAHFGEGTGNILLVDAACIGYESYLSQCPHVGWGVVDCGHQEDAGVVCGKYWVI